jgi:hypothetical protein
MKHSRPRRPSASLLISCLALFLALGGTVYAATKINGKQIKPKSIPGNRIKPGSIIGTQVKKQSLTGTQVVGSSLSGVSASSLSSVTYVASTVTLAESTPGSNGTPGTATCPPGMKVIGGGATVSSEAEGYVNDSGPTADRNSWTLDGIRGQHKHDDVGYGNLHRCDLYLRIAER